MHLGFQLQFFAMAILSQNHREIDIAESISEGKKVLIEGAVL